MSKKPVSGYTAPTELKPFHKKDEGTVHVIIETPKASRNKYKYDPKLGTFKLSRVLPDGMDFPYDFGFIPSTEGDDGDPIDVLLLMDESAFPGCMIASRLIGVIEGEQERDGQKERNDRLLAVAVQSHRHSDLKDAAELNQTLVKELGQFFVNYHGIQGAKFSVLRVKGQKEARRLLDKAIKKRKAGR
jgi:inorganic pyrophosphatase